MKKLLSLLLVVPFLGGCDTFLKAPELAEVPKKLEKPTAPVFNAGDYAPAGTELSKAADPVLPDYFQATQVSSGDLIYVQSVDKITQGTPPKEVLAVGSADPIRLAGIVTPQTGQPGYEASVAAASGWALISGTNKAKELRVIQDAVFPTDIDNIRLCAVFFKGQAGGEFADQELCLNRMMIRAGWAVVDLYSPTSFDTKLWLSDEMFARKNKRGLWGMGIAIQQRVPISLPKAKQTKNPDKNIPVIVAPRPGTTSSTTKVKVKTEVTTKTP